MNFGFMRGTKVTMEDGSQKLIEQVIIGDNVLGLAGSKNKILSIVNTRVSEKFPVLRLGESLTFSGGCLFLVKPFCYEYPSVGVHDGTAYFYHKRVENIGLDSVDPYFITDDCDYLKLGCDAGLAPTVKVVSDYNSDELFALVIDNEQTFFADGFCVYGIVDEMALAHKLGSEEYGELCLKTLL